MTTKGKDVVPGAPKKLKAHLDKLEKQFGKLQLLKDAPPLEQALFLILREGNDHKKAQRALSILQAEYVEWNELRVATPKEIVAVLEDVGLDDLDDKVSRMLALLSRLFYDFHKKDLNFVRMFEATQRSKILSTLDPLGKPILHVLLQYYEELHPNPGGTVLSMDAFKELERLGMVRKTGSANVAKKMLDDLVEEEDRYRFQYLMHKGL
jgi:endonuclease III